MKKKDLIRLFVGVIAALFILSILNLYFFNQKISELKEKNTELENWQVNDENCYDYLSNNENLVILHVDDEREFCTELLNVK
jgi:hypothetical protein